MSYVPRVGTALANALIVSVALVACGGDEESREDSDTTNYDHEYEEAAAQAAEDEYYEDLAQREAVSQAREEGYDEGYQVGYEDGFLDGYEELGRTLVRQGVLEWYRC